MTRYFSFISGQNQLTNTYAIDPNYRIGYAQMWQISVQQDLGRSLVGTITYNGTKGTGLDQTLLPNSAPSGAAPNGLPSGYIYEQSNGNSIYHGVIVPAHAPLPQRRLGQRHLYTTPRPSTTRCRCRTTSTPRPIARFPAAAGPTC